MKRKKIKFKIKDGAIINQDGNVIGALLSDASQQEIATIEASGDLAEAVHKFVEEPSKLRGAVKEFEEVIEKHEL